MVAYMTGKLKVKGDINAAMRAPAAAPDAQNGPRGS